MKKIYHQQKGQAIGGWLYKKMATRFENMALKNSDAVIAVSDEMARVVQVREEGLLPVNNKNLQMVLMSLKPLPRKIPALTRCFCGTVDQNQRCL
ncbi:MAG: hypothetical protein R2788_12115 [Saprospiraceae bacterium]